MPRRRRKNKRRTLSPAERMAAAIDDGLPPNPLVRRGLVDFDEAGVPVDFDPFAEDDAVRGGADLDGDDPPAAS